MGTLMDPINRRAMDMGVPLSVHIDPTWRCNERCIHCYLDHGEADELSLSELRELLDQMADAGTLFLTLSGGEIFLRRDLFAIVEHARLRGFDIKLKTNAILIGEKEAARIAELGVHQVQISVYSHGPQVHDAITKVPGSLERTLRAVGLLRAHCVHVVIACVLMKPNIGDFDGLQNLSRPGLAYMEGSMYGPSSADCEKWFVRTGIPSAGMRLGASARPPSGLVQIAGITASALHA